MDAEQFDETAEEVERKESSTGTIRGPAASHTMARWQRRIVSAQLS
jgi:hypothetical protein